MLPDHVTRRIAEATGHTPTELRRATRDTAPDAVADLILAAAATLAAIESELARQLDLAQRALATAAQALAAGQQTNSLGILQNTGLQVDLLAARREQAADTLTTALHTYRRVHSGGGLTWVDAG
jgi:hypothetical protein